MSGRNNRPDLTRFISKRILELLQNAKGNLVDIGCGDGSLLKLAFEEKRFSNLTGVLPTSEEVVRVKQDLKEKGLNNFIKVIRGEVEKTSLKNNFFDVVIVNSVLLLLDDLKDLNNAIDELKRISNENAILFLGEIPHYEEKLKNKSYYEKLINIIDRIGKKNFIKKLISKIFERIFLKQVIVRRNQDILVIDQNQFKKILIEKGFIIEKYFTHKEINTFGQVLESKSRYDYIIKKDLKKD